MQLGFTNCVIFSSPHFRAIDTWGAVVVIGILYFLIAIINLHMLVFPVTGSVGGDGVDIDSDQNWDYNDLSKSISVDCDASGGIFSPMPMRSELDLGVNMSIGETSGELEDANGIEVAKEIICEGVIITVSGVTLSVAINAQGKENRIDTAENEEDCAQRKLVLRNIRATIFPSRVTALMGSSGCG